MIKHTRKYLSDTFYVSMIVSSVGVVATALFILGIIFFIISIITWPLMLISSILNLYRMKGIEIKQ